MTWWLVHSRNVPRLTTCQNYITTHTIRRMTEDRYWTTFSVNQWAYKTRFFKTGFCPSRKRRLTARRSSVHFPVLFVRCWLWCITCCSRANERAVIADWNFTSSDPSLMADCHVRFRRSFFSYFPVFVRFDKTEEPYVCYSVVKRQGGRRKKWREERERVEGRNIVKDIWDSPFYCLPRYLRLRTAAEQT